MKQIILFGITLLMALSSVSQEYIPLLQEGNFWQVGQWEGTSICGFTSAQRINLAEDSIIDGQAYSKFTIQGIYSVDGDASAFCWPFAVNPGVGNSDILLREDIESRTVFQRIEGEDRLLYDFSLDVGDTLFVTSYDMEVRAEIIDISVQEISGTERRVFSLNVFQPGIGQVSIVEGIASDYGLVTPFNLAIGSGSSLMCFGNTVEQIQDTTCAPIVTSTREVNGSIPFEMFPNPSASFVNLTFEGVVLGKIRIMNLSGQVVQTYRMQSESWRFETSKLPKGIYFVSLETDKGTAVKKMVVN